MSEEMKLLHALCEALGFDVVATRDREEQKVSLDYAMNMSIHRNVIRGEDGDFLPDEDDMYTSYLVKPETIYTVVKRESICTFD